MDRAAVAEDAFGYVVTTPDEVRETRPDVILTHGPIPMPEFGSACRVRFGAAVEGPVAMVRAWFAARGRAQAMYTGRGSLRAMPHYGFVGASKAALESLVRTYAQELGPRGIRVNAVSAGVVDTDALAYFPNREQLLAEFAQRTPAGPKLTPEDVAGAVYLLCLPEAAMINGATLFVDGGFAISG